MSARSMIHGTLAGAAGTAALNAATYADMAVRGRPPSELPKKMIKEFAQRAGVTQLRKPDDELSEEQRNQETALGALLGYVDGIGAGALFGLMRPAMRDVSWFWAGRALGAFTGLLSEGIATAMHQTNPAKWGVSGWLSDIVPRFVYGWTTCLTYEELAQDEE